MVVILVEIQALAEESLETKNQAVLAIVANFYQPQANSDDIQFATEAIALYEKLVKLQPEEPEYYAALTELYHRAGRRDESSTHRQTAEKLGYKFKE